MKRWIIWLLILVLVLSGCNTDVPNSTNEGTETQNTTQQPNTPPVSLYVSGSPLETKTEGAVRVYTVDGGDITGIVSLDGDIVVFTYDGEKTTITRISGQDGIVKATCRRSGLILSTDPSTGTGENKLAYFDKDQNSIVFLDGAFHELDRVVMPEGAAGVPVLTSDLTHAFYCTGNEIRSLDLATGIPRLVCQLNMQQLQIAGLLLNDTVLYCHVTDMDGDRYSAFYSAQNGQKLGTDSELKTIASWDDHYLARRNDATVEEILIGSKDGKLDSFSVPETISELHILPENKAVVGIAYEQSGAAVTVYELSQGNRLGAVTLDGVMNVDMPLEDPNGQFVWFTARDPESKTYVLCRWEYTAAGSDDIVRIGTRYTAQNPDTDGLTECAQLAAGMSEKYHVNILLGEKSIEPADYSFVPEYQVSAYKKALNALDAAMARFPEGFFKTVGITSKNRILQINLVRDIQPNRFDVPASDNGLQYWLDQNSYITLMINDDLEQTFYRKLSHAMDTYVYARSPEYDYWEFSNPEGFQYDNGYMDYESHANSPYLQGKDRAFINAYSMTYAHEDRATVFEYAMMEGRGTYFQSERLQEKLTMLCKAVRRAFGWRNYEGTFPWEQYLKEPVTFDKKK